MCAPILNGLDRRSFSPSMGLFTRWCPSIIDLFPSHQQTNSVSARSNDLWASGDLPYTRSFMFDQQRRIKRLILSLCR